MSDLTSELNKKIEVWRNKPILNELKESDVEPVKIATLWASIIPQTGSTIKAQADTDLTKVTSKIKVRYNSGKIIKNDDWIMFNGVRRDIVFILNPYESNITLEIFCEQKTG